MPLVDDEKFEACEAGKQQSPIDRSSEGELAVVGVLLRQGKDSRLLKQLWPSCPAARGNIR